jgi:1,4-dihydroxy-2-naphthoate octaprenyltransferase
MSFNLFQAIRPKTLIIALAVILLGQVLAWQDLSLYSQSLNPTITLLCLSCCIFLQIAANLANDYFDYLSGVDQAGRLGPKRIMQTGKLSLRGLKYLILLFSLCAAVSGIYLIYIGGWVFLLLGLLSLLGIYFYSGGHYSFAAHSLGEIAVFLYFGWLGVMGSYYLQVKEFHWGLLYPASELGALIAAVMLVNNIRDMSSDKLAGKITLAYRLGPIYSRGLYCTLILLPFISLPFNPYLPWLNSVLLPLHLALCFLIRKRSAQQLNTQLAQTSLLVLLWATAYLFSSLLSPTIL